MSTARAPQTEPLVVKTPTVARINAKDWDDHSTFEEHQALRRDKDAKAKHLVRLKVEMENEAWLLGDPIEPLVPSTKPP